MRNSFKRLLLLAVSTLLFPFNAQAAVLTADTLWRGEVSLTEDLLVPAGVTLTVAPGTTVRVTKSESTKTDPEYLSPLVEITVRGTLRAEGSPKGRIRFVAAGAPSQGEWAGILVDGGSAVLSSCLIESAESALHLLEGNLEVRGSTISGNRYGAVLQGKKATLAGEGNLLTGNDYGLVAFPGAPSPGAVFRGEKNLKKELLALKPDDTQPERDPSPPPPPTSLPARGYGDEALTGETVWSGRVQVNGMVRVPTGSRLVILPGTVVEFAPRDINGDGIGENGLLVQGTIVAKGTPASPITFRSTARGHRGGWDAVNIMNSSGAWNLVEHCRIEDAYRGLHFHFSRVAVTNSRFVNCYRGIQFQEATVLIRDNRFSGNKSAVQGRDSSVEFTGNTVRGNYHGINLLRARLKASGNSFVGNGREGVRIREGSTVFEGNLVEGNRYGLLVMDAFFGSFLRNSISGNGELGFSLKNTDNMEIAGNFISGNGLNGLNLQETRGRIGGNLIADNGERGVAVLSFAGTLEENNIAANGLWSIDVDGSSDVLAPRNWWGGKEPAETVSDKRRDPEKGSVRHDEAAPSPFPFTWPFAEIKSDLTWRGDIVVPAATRVARGASLRVAPGSRLLFGPGAGLEVAGKIEALGEPGRRIVFTSADRKEPGAWGELLLEHADGSSFKECVFEYATWGLHSHFTKLSVEASLFSRNEGGMRFRSGPVRIEGCEFRRNDIGIRSFRGNAVVSGSVIAGNRVGVFVREKGGGLQLRRNMLFSNVEYNLRVGDFNDEDVDARENWWGTSSPQETIFDGRNEPGIGTVLFQPFLKEPPRREVAQ